MFTKTASRIHHHISMPKTANNKLQQLDRSLYQEIYELEANTIVGGHHEWDLLAQDLTRMMHLGHFVVPSYRGRQSG